MNFVALMATDVALLVENCPDQNPRLRNWDPGQDSAKQVVIKEGDMFRLTSDATVNSVVIQDGGKERSLPMVAVRLPLPLMFLNFFFNVYF